MFATTLGLCVPTAFYIIINFPNIGKEINFMGVLIIKIKQSKIRNRTQEPCPHSTTESSTGGFKVTLKIEVL
jgi:hypothetical protein